MIGINWEIRLRRRAIVNGAWVSASRLLSLFHTASFGTTMWIRSSFFYKDVAARRWIFAYRGFLPCFMPLCGRIYQSLPCTAVTSTRAFGRFIFLFFIGEASFHWCSAVAIGDYTVLFRIWRTVGRSPLICLLITLGLWFCRDVSRGIYL